MEQQPKRYKVVQEPFTTRERIKVWWYRVRVALTEVPPKTYGRYIEAKDGEFEDTICFYTDPHPVRYEYRHGKWVQV